MGLFGFLNRRHEQDDETGFVFGIGADDDSLREARKAGQRDGDDWIPDVNSAPPYIHMIRTRVTTAMHAKAKHASATCQTYGLRAWRLINSDGDHRDAIQRQLVDMDSILDQFHGDVKLAVKILDEIEKTYLDQAIPRWRDRQLTWRIPDFEVEVFLVEERADLDRLRDEASAKRARLSENVTKPGEGDHE
jgi:hypothetical protein